MLTLTENASTIVKTIATQTVGTEDAGLRISAQEGTAGDFAVAPAEAPEPGDQVVESEGAKVFLEETASAALSDKILDAQVDQAGSVQFQIGQQA
ncbi:hypothetical protein GCM10009841_25620 [Microlunatus panaciterrae]|uniref:Fe-S cluster assembly iron-binding protein IscA n=1 Tax=Microlunatus panaciterrae TaxID=400768 RepID=A0ABS2REL2_9ACTN|nr:Fe-S cluster assembly protein HesB [Microlunatus panaciterrae]MBM7797444.1 Fe-S cluster assembly iron-binding protein IscA [Microlunatus panaciterrae]